MTESEIIKLEERLEKAKKIKRIITFTKSNLNVFKQFDKNPELIFAHGKGNDPITYVTCIMVQLFEIIIDNNDSEISFEESNKILDDFSEDKLKVIKFIIELLEKRIVKCEEELVKI